MSEEKIIQHSQKAVDLRKTAADLNYNVKDYQSTVDYYDTVWRQINSHKINAAWIEDLKVVVAEIDKELKK